MNNKKKFIIFSLIVVILSIALVSYGIINNKFYTKVTKNIVKSNVHHIKMPQEILKEINFYQSKYFTIVKRNNALLDVFGDDIAQQDLKELSNLFNEVELKINKDNSFYERYKEIEYKFKENNGETTIEINEFAQQYYDAVDKLLNDVYKEVKSKLSEEDFIELRLSQRQWLKEVLAYNKIFEEQEFGTIGTSVKINYEIDMRKFRILLLMKYL